MFSACLYYESNKYLPFDSSMKQKNVIVSSINEQIFSACLKYKSNQCLPFSYKTEEFYLKYNRVKYCPFVSSISTTNVYPLTQVQSVQIFSVSSIKQTNIFCLKYKSNQYLPFDTNTEPKFFLSQVLTDKCFLIVSGINPTNVYPLSQVQSRRINLVSNITG